MKTKLLAFTAFFLGFLIIATTKALLAVLVGGGLIYFGASQLWEQYG